MPTIHRYKDGPPAKKLHPLEKEKQDYVFCMNASLQQREADFVMLVEDDALPTADLLPVMHHTLTRHLAVAPPHNLAYIKFYHPPHLLSYVALERERLTELWGLSVVLATLVTLAYWGPRRVLVGSAPAHLYCVWGLLGVYWGLVALAVGRPNVQQLRRLASPHLHSFTPAPSCCTPAMLYPRPGALAVLQHLTNTTCRKNYGKDSALDDLVATSSLTATLVQPNCFTHIGMYSSLRPRILDPFLV